MSARDVFIAVQHALGTDPDGIPGRLTDAAYQQARADALAEYRAGLGSSPVVLPPVARSGNQWPPQSQAAAFYGPSDGSAAWEEQYLTTIPVVYPMNMDGTPIHVIRCHKKVAASLSLIFGSIFARYGSLEAIQEIGLDRYDGCYNFRPKRQGSGLSMHAYGAAIDLDAEHNAQGGGRGRMPDAVVAIFEGEGWTWGGRWSPSSRDPMHFQAASV